MLAAMAVLWMGALSGYDVAARRLPNWLTLPGAVMIVAVAADAGRAGPALTGAIALAVVYLVGHLATPTGMGAGDVKLALGLGALTGCFGVGVWFVAAIGAPLLTALVGAVAKVVSGTSTVPHGPSMCAASVAAVLLAHM